MRAFFFFEPMNSNLTHIIAAIAMTGVLAPCAAVSERTAGPPEAVLPAPQTSLSAIELIKSQTISTRQIPTFSPGVSSPLHSSCWLYSFGHPQCLRVQLTPARRGRPMHIQIRIPLNFQ